MFKWFGKNKTTETESTMSATQDQATVEQPVAEKTLPEQPAEDRKSFGSGFSRLKSALSATGNSLFGKLSGLMQEGEPLDEDRIDELEEMLIRSDVGLDSAIEITEKIRKNKSQFRSEEALMTFLRDEFSRILSPVSGGNQLRFESGKLNIYLVMGVNGAGKTTFIGKLAHRFIQTGQRVVIGAGDTFRAAAEDQLAVWAERAGAELVRRDGADPASVIFDAIEQAKTIGAEVVILDTAGRLQNKFNLMEELRKIGQVIDKAKTPDAICETLLVLDATTGQNALKQAEVFNEAIALSGVVLTKLDGSAKGGMVLTIARQYRLPVKMVGVGEGIDDLREFQAPEFIEALFTR